MKIAKILVCLLFPCLSLAQASSHFRIHQLKVRGEIQEILDQDLDRDGFKELVVIHYTDANNVAQRYISVFWTGSDSRYIPQNSFEMAIPSRFTIYDFGSLPGEKQEVIILLSKNTAEYYRWNNHKLEGPTKLLGFSGQLVQLSDSDRLSYYDFFYDFNQDGQNELLIFQAGWAKLFYLRQNKWTETALELPMDISYIYPSGMRDLYTHMEMTVTYRTPNIFLEDLDDDSKLELFACSGKKLWIFRLNPEGIYNSEPDRKITIKMDLPSGSPSAPRQRPQYNLQITDLDQDSRADLIITGQHGTFFSPKSETRLYYGKNNWADQANKNPKPDRIWNFNAWVVGPFIRDTNADKNNDLIVTTIESGIFQTIQTLVASDFPVEWRYYLSTNHTLPDQPSAVDRINLRIDLPRGRMLGGIPNVFADFNGDNVDDLIYGKSETELMVVIKDRKAQRTSNQELIKIAPGNFPITTDLNQDHKDDIILIYSRQGEAKPGEFNVLMNLGNW
jgi:hypothetical protein